MSKLWVVELNIDSDKWEEPGSWHIDEVEPSTSMNLVSLMRGQRPSNWVTLGLATSHEEAISVSKLLREILKHRKGYEV